MKGIVFSEREMSKAEFLRMERGFEEHAIENGEGMERHERHGFVAMDGDRFIGCSSGLVYRFELRRGTWFTLTDLWVDKEFRRNGIGTSLLTRLEARIRQLGVTRVLLWTADFEGPMFYASRGYTVFLRCDGWYGNGAARVGFVKSL